MIRQGSALSAAVIKRCWVDGVACGSKTQSGAGVDPADRRSAFESIPEINATVLSFRLNAAPPNAARGE
jgi:hypothetical protein